jgi:hypothetical protein
VSIVLFILVGMEADPDPSKPNRPDPDPQHWYNVLYIQLASVGDRDPEDPHVFGPPRSRSISQSYGPDMDPSLFIKVLSGLK